MKKLLAFAIASTLTAPAMASDVAVEVIAGLYKTEISGTSDAGSETTLGYGVRGVFQTHKYIAIEAAWNDYGKAKFDQFDINLSSLSVGAKGMFALTDSISIHARAGIAYAVADYDNGFFAYGNNSLYFGFGAEYTWSSKLYVGAAYSHLEFELGDAASLEFSANGYQAYLGYRF